MYYLIYKVYIKMDASLEDIIKEIGKDYGFEDKLIEPYIKTLR